MIARPDQCRMLCDNTVMRGTLTFTQWMQQVTAVMQSAYGLHPDDLEDFSYMDEFESGASPKSAARRAMRNAGADFV